MSTFPLADKLPTLTNQAYKRVHFPNLADFFFTRYKKEELERKSARNIKTELSGHLLFHSLLYLLSSLKPREIGLGPKFKPPNLVSFFFFACFVRMMNRKIRANQMHFTRLFPSQCALFSKSSLKLKRDGSGLCPYRCIRGPRANK